MKSHMKAMAIMMTATMRWGWAFVLTLEEHQLGIKPVTFLHADQTPLTF